MRHSLIKTALKTYTATPTEADYEFLAQETNKSVDWVREQVAAIVCRTLSVERPLRRLDATDGMAVACVTTSPSSNPLQPPWATTGSKGWAEARRPPRKTARRAGNSFCSGIPNGRSNKHGETDR